MYAEIKLEISSDILGRGYSSMSDQQVADSLNSLNDRSVNEDTVDSATIFDNIDLAEFGALNSAKQSRVDRILSLGAGIKVNGQVRGEMIAIFGGGSTTISNIAASIKSTVSRGEELGFGELSAQMINNARTGLW